jgi:hypothetical protein
VRIFRWRYERGRALSTVLSPKSGKKKDFSGVYPEFNEGVEMTDGGLVVIGS